MIDHIRHACVKIVSCGLPPGFPFASIVGSVFAFPVLGLFMLLAQYIPDALIPTIIIFAIVSLLAVITVPHDPTLAPPFAIDKMWGVIIACTGLELTIKIALVGFVLFHVIRLFVPFIIKQIFGIDLENHGGFVSMIIRSLLSGGVVNVIMQLIIWTAK